MKNLNQFIRLIIVIEKFQQTHKITNIFFFWLNKVRLAIENDR